jgi:hypothetical protein
MKTPDMPHRFHRNCPNNKIYPPPSLTISNSTVASAPTNETINPKENLEQ